jgi:hypothetical protein
MHNENEGSILLYISQPIINACIVKITIVDALPSPGVNPLEGSPKR